MLPRRLLLLLLLAAGLHAPATARADEVLEIRELLSSGNAIEAESRAHALLESAELGHGYDSAEAATARDLLIESRWRSPAGPDSSLLDMAEENLALKTRLFGDESVEAARSLYNLAVIHELLGGSSEGCPRFAEVVHVLEAAGGEPELIHARAQFSLAQCSADLGQVDTALTSFETAWKLYVELRGPRSAKVASVLGAKGKFLLGMGRFEEAEQTLFEALGVSEKALGAEDANTCDLRTSLAACSYYMGDLAEAGRRQRESLDCMRKSLPEDDPRVLNGMKNLAWLESEYGNYAAADTTYRRVIELAEAANGPDDPRTLDLYRIYGAHLYLSGAYSEALVMVRRAEQGLRKALGAQSPRTDDAISTLAEIHRVLGNYGEARRLYQESADMNEALGAREAPLALRCNGLGLVAMDLGDAAEARRWFERALELSREYEGETHYHTGRAYANLADALALQGDTETALKDYAKAMEIFETELGRESPEYVESSALLGLVMAQHGDLDGAAEILETTYEVLAQQDQPAFMGANRHQLARVRLEQGRHAEAEELETLAIEQLGLAHGRESHPVARASLIRGWARAYQGEYEAAFSDATRAEAIGLALTEDLIPWLPERTALAWAQRRPDGSSLMWELARRAGRSEYLDAAWAATVRSRAWMLDELGRRVRLATAQTDPETRSAMEDYRLSRERLANAVLDGSSDLETLEAASQAKSEAEQRLVGTLDEELRATPADASRLPASFPANAALLSYRVLRDEDQHPYRFIALVLTPEKTSPSLFDLGPEADIAALVGEWSSAMREGSYAIGPLAVTAIEEIRELGGRLRRSIWDPVVPALDGASEILIVPDGVLAGVAFAALPTEDGAWLVDDERVLVTLSAERDLLESTEEDAATGLFCVGDPDFDGLEAPLVAQAEVAIYRGHDANCVEFEDLEFDPLPHSLREVETVSGLWSGRAPTLLVGAAATGDAVRTLVVGHGTLHFATHAFYLGSDCASGSSMENELARTRVAVENPLLLSGLALTGANQRGLSAVDGILTAEEIATLDLRGTQLAVLSACQTAAGVSVPGEGVMGLRRAFRLAGARTLVTSLWPVEDEAAADWMVAFYSAMWRRGDAPERAAKEASLATRKSRAEAGLSTHPAHWAAFVVAR